MYVGQGAGVCCAGSECLGLGGGCQSVCGWVCGGVCACMCVVSHAECRMLGALGVASWQRE